MIDFIAVSNIARKSTVATCVTVVERIRLIICILIELYIEIVEHAILKLWNTLY